MNAAPTRLPFSGQSMTLRKSSAVTYVCFLASRSIAWIACSCQSGSTGTAGLPIGVILSCDRFRPAGFTGFHEGQVVAADRECQGDGLVVTDDVCGTVPEFYKGLRAFDVFIPGAHGFDVFRNCGVHAATSRMSWVTQV